MSESRRAQSPTGDLLSGPQDAAPPLVHRERSARSNNEHMAIRDRLADADVLWAAGRREGALLSVLVAIAAASREEWPDIEGDKKKFCKFVSRRMSGAVDVVRDGKSVTFESLLYKFYRNSLAHEASLPQNVVFASSENGTTYLHVVLGLPPEGALVISEDWYWWLQEQARCWTDGEEPTKLGPGSALTVPPNATVAYAIGTQEDVDARKAKDRFNKIDWQSCD